jgi:hypothetical protein
MTSREAALGVRENGHRRQARADSSDELRVPGPDAVEVNHQRATSQGRDNLTHHHHHQQWRPDWL